MDVGATKIMEGPRPFVPETPTESDGGLAPTSANSFNDVSLDSGQTVAVETTPNPLSYWPPPSSTLPLLNNSKDVTDVSQSQILNPDRSSAPDSLESPSADRDSSPKSFGDNTVTSKCSEVSHSKSDVSLEIQPTKFSHHNLPPIAGITSSHNYRVREVQKQSNLVDVITKASSEIPEGKDSTDKNVEKKISSDAEKNESAGNKSLVDSEKLKDSTKKPSDESLDCDIVEVPVSSSVERHKTANSDYVFSVPAAVNSVTHSKSVLSPRVSTPFVQVSTPNGSPFNETLTLNVNSNSNLSAGSPSPSGRMASSPHFMGPSPTGSLSTNIKCASPSESSRIIRSPHSNLTSPSNLHRVPSSISGDVLRMAPSPHFPHINPSSPSQRTVSSPYVPHSNMGNVSAPKISVNNSSVQNYHPETNRLRAGHESADLERERAIKESIRQNQANNNSRTGLSQSNQFQIQNSVNTSHINPPPRIHQHSDSQSCRNPFELPVSKSYSQSYHYQQHPQQQQQHFSNYSNNIRHSTDPVPNHEHFMSMQQTTKEHERPSGNTFYATEYKSTSSRLGDEKEFERHHNMQYKHIFTSQSSSMAKGYPLETSQNVGLVQRRTDEKPLRNEVHQRDYIKMEIARSKPYDTNVTGSSGWNKTEISEIDSKSAYLNAQNVNKTFSKVNGNEYPNIRMTETGYVNSSKVGLPHSESFGGRFSASNGDKQNSNFSTVNQTNSMSQRFPPVPQSNYDLNRQIYDSMTGGNRSVQPSVSRALEKSSMPFGNLRETNITNPQTSKSQSFYRELEKGKTYVQNNPMKQNEYPGPPRIPNRSGQDYRGDSFGLPNTSLGKSTPDGNHRPAVSQHSGLHSQIQPSEVRLSQSGSVPSHSRIVCQGFPSRMTPSHPISQASSTRSQNQSVLPSKHQHSIVEYESKLMEAKSRGNTSQFPSQNSQPNIQTVISNQMKSRAPATIQVPTRSKRESPLDLSVKTVRQSADSTAKDDGDAYVQNLRNFMQTPNPLPENRFPVNQSNNSSASIGAPKIDFTPDFSGFHADSQQSTPTLHHKTDVSILPPVESFKKFPTRIPTSTLPDGKFKTGFMSPKYVSPQTVNSQKPLSSVPDHNTSRYSDQFKLEPQKRPSNEPIRTHPSQPKIPKIDSWKLAFDQQIEQRLNSARLSQQTSQYGERTLNGMDVPKSSALIGSQYSTNHHISRHSNSNLRGANMYPQPPVQSSAAPYNPSYIQQPQCQPAAPQTPLDKIQHGKNVGHSPDPEQIIKQISKGVMPDHKLLQDKNVLSILKSSLEEKEAKLMQLREAAKQKDKYKDVMTGDLSKKPFHAFDQTPKGQTHAKQSLPSFGALTLERICAPPSFPGHRLNLPRANDTVKIDVEPTQKYFSSVVKNEQEKSGIPNTDLSPHDDAQGPPTDLDGLAAFLAARIRTKGELKQVGPILEPVNHQLKAQPGNIMSSGDSIDRRHSSSHLLQPPSFQSAGSPPKLIRESRLLPPLRRRHFEEEIPTTSGAQADERTSIPSRDPNGIRSSSETSVFDFRESDSESEMPVLERQTLEGMRRDRKTFGSKQNVFPTSTKDTVDTEKPDVIAELDKSQPDPFWDTAFDMFVEQLEKRPPKRSIRRKKIYSRIPYIINSESEEGEKSKDGMRSDKISPETTDEESVKPTEEINEKITFEVKKEPEERIHFERVHENPGKLSASRLKVYRDEMLRENKLREIKLENEKLEKIKDETTEKIPEQQKTEEFIMKKEKDIKKENVEIKAKEKSKVSGKDSESESESVVVPSEPESVVEDEDESLSLSELESESSESDESRETSNSECSSNESEDDTTDKKKTGIQTRLQTKSTRQRQVKGTGMRLRSKPVSLPKTATKKPRKRKKRKELYYPNKRKKPSFGDGSHFRPGWEEEFYKFKQQLRMPEKLISISKPPKRTSASLPDLDPYRNSTSVDSSDVPMTKKSSRAPPETDESDMESGKHKSKTQDSSETTSSLLKSRNGKKSQSSSILNMLVDKYGKGHMKKQQKDLKAINERKSPRILPKATNKPELLPTPSLGIGKENVLKDKKKIKDIGKKKMEENDSVYLGYFRKKTVNNFKEAFKQKVGALPEEFNPVILKSRTRNQTKDMKKKATLIEVFGEERPASAPPLSRDEDTSTEPEKIEKQLGRRKSKIVKTVAGGVITRGRGKLTRSGRPGLRSTAVLRSNKAVQISKRHLNSGRKRNIDLLRIRALASKKFSYLVTNSDNTTQLPITKKRLKLRNVRRKFRSGFDYIRKKKKLKKDGDSADGSVKKLPTRPMAESVEDIQNEIKTWVINKGLGETILHRAARLGYTDIAAYCLEKMDCSPSPRDNAGYTPLHEACSRGHLDIAKLLLLYGASVSESAKGGIRPLHEAAENGFTELIRLLLSYGADPLLETYTGHTALSLVSDEEARRLIQHHLADVQGNVAPVWTFLGPSSLFDPPDNGYDPLCDPPSPRSVHSDCELEISEAMLPALYVLSGDRETDRRWVMVRDLVSYTKAKNKDSLLRQLGPTTVREMKLQEFYEQAKSCNLLGTGDRPLTKPCKVMLVPYDEKVRQLLGVEKVVV